MDINQAPSGAAVKPMSSPMDLFVHELSDLHSAETIIVQMLDAAVGAVTNAQLVEGFRKHQQESAQHARNLERAFQILGQSPHPVVCHAAEGLFQSLREGIALAQSPDVIDGLATAGGCKTEHLEIAGYTGALKKAIAMGQNDVAELLRMNLQQELATLDRLERIAEELDGQAAKTMDGMISQQNQADSAVLQ